MEYCAKGSFKMKLDNVGPFDINELKRYFSEILVAIKYFHSLNIVHRDLKPANFAFDKLDRPKILDWGFSTMIEEGELLDTFCGSRPYIPPECILQKPYDGKKCDIWALGVTIYMCAFNRSPWLHDIMKENEQNEHLLEGKIYVPPHANPVLIDLIKCMIKVNPEERISAEDALNHEFFIMHYCRSLYQVQAGSSQIFIPKIKKRNITNTSRSSMQTTPANQFQLVSHKRIHSINTFKNPIFLLE